ncbi:MAG: hypothetical protein K5643_00620 [Saccharofermentans sp.]|nr:hypothetical protein [Saccharofermentans sp.]
MKFYKSGIFMGLTSIASSVFLLGIPSGTAPLEVANGALFAAGIISVLMMGPVMKKYASACVSSIIYVIALMSLSTYIELNTRGYSIYMLGFVPGAAIALSAIITSLQNKGKMRIWPSMIINIIAMLVSGANAGFTLVNAGFSIL